MLISAVFSVCLLFLATGSAHVGLVGKSLLFPDKTDNAYIKILPDKQMSLTAFTLCMRVATEQIRGREVIIFAYRIPHDDEFNVWIEGNGRISFNLRSDSDRVIFDLAPLSILQTHLCFTWDSVTGLIAMWVNGRRSAFQVYRKAQPIHPGGTVLLGQVPNFDTEQSFVGEILDVKLWDYILPACQIKALYNKDEVQMANVFDWNTINYEIHNNVLVVQDDFCPC